MSKQTPGQKYNSRLAEDDFYHTVTKATHKHILIIFHQ